MTVAISVNAQQDNKSQNIKVSTNQEPFYIKGEQALYNEVLNGIKYSDEAKKNYIEGEVTLSFDVMADSSLNNIVIMKDAGYNIGDEVKKYVQKLKFAPAKQMGMAVRMNVIYNFPVMAH